MALPHHFCFGFQQERLCKTDLSRLKLSVNIAAPALNYCIQKWDKYIKYLGSRLFIFRTWIVRQRNKLTDIVTSSWLGIGKLDKELFKCDTCIWNYLITSSWNKWECMSVNKLWTVIFSKQKDRVSNFGLVSSSTRIRVSTKFSTATHESQFDGH